MAQNFSKPTSSSFNHEKTKKKPPHNIDEKPKGVYAKHFRWLFSLVSKFDKFRLLAGLLSLFATSSMNLATPTIIGKVVDFVISSNSVADYNVKLIRIGAVLGIGAFSSWLRTTCFRTVAMNLNYSLRDRMFKSIVMQDVPFLEEQKSGELVSILLQDTETSANIVSKTVPALLRSLNSTIGGMALLFIISPKLALLSLSIVPTLSSIVILHIRRTKQLQAQAKAANGEAMGLAGEKLANFRIIKQFGMENYEAKQFALALEQAMPFSRDTIFADGLLMGGMFFCLSFSLLSIVFAGSLLIRQGSLSVGNLISFAIYSSTVGLGFSGLSDGYSDLKNSSVSIERVKQYASLDLPSASGSSLEKVSGKLVFEDVSFCYPSRKDVTVFSKLSFELKPGRVTAITGASGTGKSTICNLMTRLYEPGSGKIYLDDNDILSLESTWLRQSVFGVVNQEPQLFSGTIASNIAYGRDDATFDEIQEAARKANAEEFIMGLPDAYNTILGENGAQLSLGQKQRIAIARAILKDPPCLIFDEATSALDGDAEKQVHVAVERVMAGRTVLIISHRLSTLKFADVVMLLENGQIVSYGTLAEMKKRKAFLSLTEAQE